MPVRPLRILIIGASGFVGSHLVPVLAEHGHTLRLASRLPAKLARPDWAEFEQVTLDLLKPETLPPALKGIEVIYYLAHSMTEGSGFAEREQQAARHLASVAAQASVQRIIYLGAVCPPAAESAHLISRTNTGQLLRQHAVPVIELRAPVIIGPGSAAFEVMRDLVGNLPLMLTPRWVRSTMAPIGLADLLFYLQQLLHATQLENKIFDVSGPEILTYQQQLQRLAQLMGRRIQIIPVPFLSPALSAHWLHFITSVPAGIARALIGGLKHDLVTNSQPIEALFPKRLQSFNEAANAALKAEPTTLFSQDPSLAHLLAQQWRDNYAYYPKETQAQLRIEASAAAIWRELCQIGAKPRYFAFDILWRIRELMDAALGGNGCRYTRRDPYQLQLGDRIDSWFVARCDPEQCLTLHFGMKAPGMGGLTFKLHPTASATITDLRIRCWWFPAGAAGLFYWWAMLPAHAVLFKRMASEIRRLTLQSV